MSDELLVAIEKYRKKPLIIKFLKSPAEVLEEKPFFLLLFSGLLAIIFISLTIIYAKIRIYDALLLSSVIAVAPPGLFDYYKKRKIKKIEAHFPDLLTDLALSRKAGMTLQAAVDIAARGEYGELTEGIKWINRMMSWGLSFEEAMSRFAKRYPTPLIKRSVSIIMEATRAGGEIGNILEVVAENARETKALEKKRASESFSYIVICYLSFLVFVGVIVILTSRYIPMLEETAAKTQEVPGITGIKITPQIVEMYKMVFYHVLVVQGFFNGIIAGKVGEGYVVAGFKHAVILVAIATLVYLVFIK